MIFTVRWRDIVLEIWCKMINISGEVRPECGFIIDIETRNEDTLESWFTDSFKARTHYDLLNIEQRSIYLP